VTKFDQFGLPEPTKYPQMPKVIKMNEQIEKLADQCWSKSEYDLSIDPWFNHRKFAELIIQECLLQCYIRGMNDELYLGQLKAAQYIEEHFGVTL
jgi:hypothetical protein